MFWRISSGTAGSTLWAICNSWLLERGGKGLSGPRSAAGIDQVVIFNSLIFPTWIKLSQQAGSKFHLAWTIFQADLPDTRLESGPSLCHRVRARCKSTSPKPAPTTCRSVHQDATHSYRGHVQMWST